MTCWREAICSWRPSQFIMAVIDHCKQPTHMGNQLGWAASQARQPAGLDSLLGWRGCQAGRATELCGLQSWAGHRSTRATELGRPTSWVTPNKGGNWGPEGLSFLAKQRIQLGRSNMLGGMWIIAGPISTQASLDHTNSVCERTEQTARLKEAREASRLKPSRTRWIIAGPI